ncbi:MAG: hypothetical protein K9J16_00250 [Melioribacteraceae bacterium]|nr:hypothetical protein [Melioribacteraceae bacterium]MCF8353940.1 hypothetical protein [Melioribacteraceae bacterium]MCF8392697.1 hypothetical protein [Melioribacteraceae bacterium]MCF8417719.1 hypothetical protein [Melioribacteraceae bacterium]
MRTKNLIFVILISSISLLKAQGEAALFFLTVPQSVLNQSAGSIGVSNVSDDIFNFYRNPAMLGQTSKQNFAGVFLSPIQQFNQQVGPLVNSNNYGFSAGYNFEKTKLAVPISVGIGFLHNKFSYGVIYFGEPLSSSLTSFESYDVFNSFSIGLGLKYLLNLNLGMSIKSIESQLGPYPNTEGGKVEVTAMDYGATLTAPISSLFFPNTKFNLDKTYYLYPTTNLTIGLALLNFGDDIFYFDESQIDPLPRMSVLGITYDLGISMKLESGKIKMINYSFSSEVEDYLIKRNYSDYHYEYQSILSDVQLIDNLFGLNYNSNIRVHKGHIIEIMETVKLATGSYDGKGERKTNRSYGVAISTKGIFQLLSEITDNTTIDFISNHIELNYYNSSSHRGNNYRSNFESVSLLFKGIIL